MSITYILQVKSPKNSKKVFKIFGIMLTGLLWLSGCTSSDSSSDSTTTTTAALPDATYTVDSITCNSTGSSPDYASIGSTGYIIAAALGDFDTTEHTFTLASAVTTETWKDADCTLTEAGKVSANATSTFTRTKEATYTWDTSTCSFSKTISGTVYSISSTSPSGIFVDSTDTSADSPFTVSVSGSVYTLKLATADYSTFGCGTSDNINLTMTKQ